VTVPAPIPSRKEIRRLRDEIRAGWSVGEERKRRGLPTEPRPYTFPRLTTQRIAGMTLFKPD